MDNQIDFELSEYGRAHRALADNTAFGRLLTLEQRQAVLERINDLLNENAELRSENTRLREENSKLRFMVVGVPEDALDAELEAMEELVRQLEEEE